MTARMTYLVCRKAPDRPEGVIYWDGTHRIEKSRRATIVVGDPVMFRADAWDGDEAAAQLVAGVLTELGPSAGLPGAPKWEVLPAAIEMPEKRGTKAAPSPSLSPEISLASEIAMYVAQRGSGRAEAQAALKTLGAETAETLRYLDQCVFPKN